MHKRREREATENYVQVQTAPQQPALPHQETSIESTNTHLSTKRKRDEDDQAPSESATKKNRPGEQDADAQTQPQSSLAPPSVLKRDRENATVVVNNLPVNTSENRVRQYFRDVSNL